MRRCVLFLLLLLLSAPVFAEALPDQPHLVVSGQAEVKAVPDTLTMSLSLSEVGKEAAAASAVVEERARLLIGTMKKFGVAARDIQASRLEITPHYNWNNQAQVYVGTEVAQQIDVTLRDLAQYNDLIRAVLDSKVVRINSTNLESSREKELRKQALQAAIADARQQAELLAAGVGAKVGPVYAVTSSGPGYAFAEKFAVAMEMRAPRAAVFEPGEISLSESVQVVFYLVQ